MERNNAAHFALCSAHAYKDNASTDFGDIGYDDVDFIDHQGAQCYLLSNDEEVALVFRGTEPKELSDIKADLYAFQKDAKGQVGDVHCGFAGEVDKIFENLPDLKTKGKKFYIAGHSLGAAMATIAASRLQETHDITCLYTYGSPRVGDSKFVRNLNITHERYKNNNDVVASVPFTFMGYRHHGELKYINFYGNLRTMTFWQRVKDQLRGRWKAIKKRQLFDGIYDHDILDYARKIDKCGSGQ
ncbi:MAG: hypothetical protein CBB97_22550 [Candidatus Endolissoclinum sp. TMED37]|nr:MAG: hypothetical protein CBB97_22550 [Candidatus Endolissoclinum sp. TMED37]